MRMNIETSKDGKTITLKVEGIDNTKEAIRLLIDVASNLHSLNKTEHGNSIPQNLTFKSDD